MPECFVLPNAWDIGSARYLQSLGFKAVATTSSGFAWSVGHADSTVSRDGVLAHLRDVVGATDSPMPRRVRSSTHFSAIAPDVR